MSLKTGMLPPPQILTRANMKQLNFEFLLPTRYTMDSLTVGDANQHAIYLLADPISWTQKMAIIVGLKGSGKTHHAHIWADMNNAKVVTYKDLHQFDLQSLLSHGALVIEDIDDDYDNEIALFHAINMVLQTGAYLLMSSRQSVAALDIKTADLLSRLRMALPIELGMPNDDMLIEIFWKLVSDKQMDISADFAEYILDRSARDISTLQSLVAKMENFVIDTGQSLKKKHIAQLLGAEHVNHD